MGLPKGWISTEGYVTNVATSSSFLQFDFGSARGTMSYKTSVIKCLKGWIRSEPRKNYSKAYKICLESIELASVQSQTSLLGLDGFSKGLIEKIHIELQSTSDDNHASPCSPVQNTRLGKRCKK